MTEQLLRDADIPMTKCDGLIYDGVMLSVIFVGMEITPGMIDNLAHLSRLRFNETEKQEIRADLQKMVAFVEKLEALDTKGIQPLLHMGDAQNVWREDKVWGSVSREEGLLNAPQAHTAFFAVPKVIKK